MHTIPHIAPRNARRAVDAFLSRPVGQRWLDALANAYWLAVVASLCCLPAA